MSAFTVRASWMLGRRSSMRRRVARGALLGFGWALIVVGVVGAVLPGHLGVAPLIIGLIIVLRSSIQARRRFVRMQRRHPKVMFPIRRLLRREPEVLAVAWQQILRFERLILPRRWRLARRWRRWMFPRRRRSPQAA